MKRKPEAQEDGSLWIKLRIPPQLWELARALADDWSVRPEQALGIMLVRVARLVDSGNAETLGPEYAYAWDKLVASDRASVGGLPPIDVSKLHMSNKTKSGFVGVYANGKGFRAMAKSPGKGSVQVSIGTFPTGERAAWARYIHYKRLKLPYGTFEEWMDRERAARPELSDEELIEWVNTIRSDVNLPPFSIEEDAPTQDQPTKPVVPFGLEGVNIDDV